MISTFIFSLCFGFLWTIFAIYPPLHKVLRRRKNYNIFLVISIVLPIISLLSYDENNPNDHINMIFLSLLLLLFMILYKYFDAYIFKNYGRNLYLSVRYNSLWNDDESDQQTGVELLFQIMLLVAPLVFCGFLIYLFETFK